MARAVSSTSTNWILPSNPKTFTSTLPSHEEDLPFRVNREGVQNYIKNRGSLNIGDWAIEGRRMSTTTAMDSTLTVPPPKVLGADALQNYTKSRCTTPNLIGGRLEPPDSRQGMRVTREALPNYEKSHYSQTKDLLDNYGRLSAPALPVPHTQGQVNLSERPKNFDFKGICSSLLQSSITHTKKADLNAVRVAEASGYEKRR